MIDERYLEMYKNECSKELPLTFISFIFLVFVYEEQKEFLRIAFDEDFILFSRSIDILEKCGLVKWHSDDPKDIMLRKTGEDLFKRYMGKKKKKIGASEIKLWINSWRELFPPGVNSGGYRYRGDRGEVLKKMVKFVNEYDYTQEEIFKATKDYVERFSLKGYMYMQLAQYFIHKQNVGSTLASECEGLKDKKSKEGPGYGRQVV